jgi:hypothetical protein
MRFCLTTFSMRQFSFSSILAATPVRSVGGKPFLTRRYSGSASPPAELIRYASCLCAISASHVDFPDESSRTDRFAEV